MIPTPVPRITMLAGVLSITLGLPAYGEAQMTESWVRYHPDLRSHPEAFSDMTVGPSGNVFATGSTSIPPVWSDDIVTIRYSASGGVVWSRRWDNGGDDRAGPIFVDPAKNVYVAGRSGNNWILLKYDQMGNLLWDATAYIAGYSLPVDMAVDADGNAYITGTYLSSGEASNYVVVKINELGIYQWTSDQYHFDLHDYPTAIAVDGSGQTYVTGQVQYDHLDNPGDYDIATVKYSDTGTLSWVRHERSADTWDEGVAIVMDGPDYVYIAGTYNGRLMAAKYAAPFGTQAWFRFDPDTSGSYGVGLSIDGDHNVTVAGARSGDLLVIEYNENGGTLWTRTYGEQNRTYHASTMTTNFMDEIYVAGTATPSQEIVVARFSDVGAHDWVARYEHPGSQPGLIAVGARSSGEAAVAAASFGSFGHDYLTVGIDDAGQADWVSRYNGEEGRSQGLGVAIDDLGNSYTVGYIETGSDRDVVTLKRDALGTVEWMQTYDGPANDRDEARFVELGASDEVYVAGNSKGDGSGLDWVLIKYDGGGQEQWTARLNGPDYADDTLTGLAVGEDGSIYLTGQQVVLGGGQQATTAKYNSVGQFQWLQRYEGIGNTYAADIDIGPSGDVFVVGGDWSTTDYVTRCYDPGGVELWERTYDGPFGDYEQPNDLAVDAQGNVIVTGMSYSEGFNGDYATVKYGADGNELWTARWDDPNSGYDQPIAVTTDDVGNVYVTGSGAGAGTGAEIYTIKYDPFGQEQWVSNHAGSQGLGADAIDIAFEGNLYVAGQEKTELGITDVVLLWYDSNGALQQKITSDYNAGPDYARALAVNGARMARIAGYSGHVGNVITTAAYDLPAPVSAPEQRLLPDPSMRVHPNPFNPSTTVSFELSEAGPVTLAVYSLRGRLITKLFDGTLPAGPQRFTWNGQDSQGSPVASGAYLLDLRQPAGRTSRKVSMVK